MTFKESQKFGSTILWCLRVLTAATLIGSMFVISMWGEDIFLLLAILFCALTVSLPYLLIEVSSLKTEIDKHAIQVNFRPFTQKRYEWADIQSANIVDYGFVGGWGVRVGTKFGTVYNTQGSMGLHIVVKDGTNVVIGTQRPNDLSGVASKYMA